MESGVVSLVDWLTEIIGISTPSTLEVIFLMSGFLGTAFFLILMIMMMLGDILGGVFDSVFDTDISMDSDLSFELFSIQGLAAAVMMFGWVGMFTLEATETEIYAVIVGGFSAAASMYGVGLMLKGINSLQSDGTMKHEDAIGERGQVYSRIRANESGKVQVAVDGTLRTLTARAKDKSLHIDTGEFIKVVDVIGSTLIVELLSDGDELVSEEE
ncbi:MAG: NfeD family protein [Euryarchaeota archaeon]|jgi:membrane protein implicated in regulation of membrane protease activity|nr:NfeD family protein [Euryarchaeota archaeon]